MTRITTYCEMVVICISLTLCISQAIAQVQVISSTGQSDKPDTPTIYKMTVSPAPEPQPALKYHFLVPPVDQIKGNAASFYYKGMVFEGPDMWRPSEELTDKIDQWREAPLADLPLKEIADKVLFYGETAWQPLHEAAYCDHCDWEDPIRQSGFATPLPQSQKMRSVARGIALRARTEIAAKEYSKAIDTLGLGYALSRNMGRGCCLVQCLIGLAIQEILDEQAITLMAADDSPNLYWALTDLADQPVDLRQALSFESKILEFSLPEIAELGRRAFTSEEALKLSKETANFTSRGFQNPATQFLWVVQTEPEARKYLLGSAYNAEQLNAMPLLQVVLLYRWKQFEIVRDDCFKFLELPDDENRAAIARSDKAVQAAYARGEGLPFTDLLPALHASSYARLRSMRQTNMLRIVEALRMYAAEHGRWPEQLDDIKAVPIPSDPYTGKPFEYSLEDGMAILTAPPDIGNHYSDRSGAQRYEITLRQSSNK